MTQHYGKFYRNGNSMTIKKTSFRLRMTHKLFDWAANKFERSSKKNQRRLLWLYLKCAYLASPFIITFFVIKERELPTMEDLKDVYGGGWKEFETQMFTDLEQEQKKNTKLHRSLK